MGKSDSRTLLRVLPVGDFPANAEIPAMSDDEHRFVYRAMLRVRLLDEKMLLMQRQGRIAFFGPSSGQEASICGSGFVARKQDWLFPALREGGALLMRGFPLERYFGQLFGNVLDVQKGRQQPMHFSSGDYKYLSLSSVIATQLPQAVGAAYAAKIKGDDCVTFGYIGDGGTSEHDFHMAMNFSAVWKVPCVIICQNNQWAISVPFEQQTASKGIAVKASAYGMPGVAVDGNDALAVIAAPREAHARALRGEGPTLLELVTYRRGGHSSSDDPTRYRDEARTEAAARRSGRPLRAAFKYVQAATVEIEGVDVRMSTTTALGSSAPKTTSSSSTAKPLTRSRGVISRPLPLRPGGSADVEHPSPPGPVSLMAMTWWHRRKPPTPAMLRRPSRR